MLSCRSFVLGIKIVNFVLLLCVLIPVIRHFGMMGAAVVAVAIQISERLMTGFAAARAVQAKVKDLRFVPRLFQDCWD